MSKTAHSAAQAVNELARPLPRPRWAELSIPVLSFLGMLVAAYLTWIHWSGSKAFCAGIGDCLVVNTSRYAEVAGIPVALLGFGMYATLFGLSWYRRRVDLDRAVTLGLAIFGLSLMGVLYSAYLTYIELAVLHAICPWCVISAVLITLIFGFATRDVVTGAIGEEM